MKIPVYHGVEELKYTNPYYQQAALILLNPYTTDTFPFPDKTCAVIEIAAKKKYALDNFQSLKNPEAIKENLRRLMNKAVLSLADYLRNKENSVSDGITTNEDSSFGTVSSLINNKRMRSFSLSSLSELENRDEKKDKKLLLHQQKQKEAQFFLKNSGYVYLQSWNRLLDYYENVHNATNNTIATQIIDQNNVKEEQAKKMGKVETILPKIQAIVRGRLVRKNLSQIQLQLLYQKEQFDRKQKQSNEQNCLENKSLNVSTDISSEIKLEKRRNNKKKKKDSKLIKKAIEKAQKEEKQLLNIVQDNYAELLNLLNTKESDQLRFLAVQIKDVKKHIPELSKSSYLKGMENTIHNTFDEKHKKSLEQLNQEHNLQFNAQHINAIIAVQKKCARELLECYK